MSSDYSFPLFDSMLYGKLNPLLESNSTENDYVIRLQEQVLSSETDTGLFALDYLPSIHPKTTYYGRLLLHETYGYCNELLALIKQEADSNVRCYYREMLLDRHLKKCMGKVGARIREGNYVLPSTTAISTLAEDMEKSINGWVLYLWSLCLTKAYLEIQEALKDVVVVRLTEAMLYAAYFAVPASSCSFLKRRPAAPSPCPTMEKKQMERVVAITDSVTEDIEFMTPVEIASKLRLDVRTVRRWLEKGTLPGMKSGRSWLVDKKDFNAYLYTLKSQHP